MPLAAAAAADAVWVHSLWQLPRPRPPSVTLPNPQAIGQLATEWQKERERERVKESLMRLIYILLLLVHTLH